MDRSFLADENVIAASRKFVCIRLATYENAEENELLKTIFAPGGNLENTVFCLLSPDGKTQLVRAGRSPVWAFGGVRGPGINSQPVAAIKKMAASMATIAKRYPGKDGEQGLQRALPYLADVRLALNVAASDRQPLLVVHAGDAKQRRAMEHTLSPLAWSEPFVGQMQFVPINITKRAQEIKLVKGMTMTPSYIVVQPNTFGLAGTVIATIEADADSAKLRTQLAAALKAHKPSELSYEEHRRTGAKQGVSWESKTPNTDRGGRRSRP